MKTVSRNKFLHCFRPVADTDLILDPQNRSTDLGFSYVNVENKQHVKPLSSESVFLERGCSMNSENSVNLQPPKRSFLGIIKAVIFDTFLVSFSLQYFVLNKFEALSDHRYEKFILPGKESS